MRFKTNIIHRIEWIDGKPYYKCNRAVGVLSGQQIIHKTTEVTKVNLTCKNCMRCKDD